jgi:hypothetical protein
VTEIVTLDLYSTAPVARHLAREEISSFFVAKVFIIVITKGNH